MDKMSYLIRSSAFGEDGRIACALSRCYLGLVMFTKSPASLRYSIDQLLLLRRKPCLCIKRHARRRLFYHGIYVQHIAVLRPSSLPFGPRQDATPRPPSVLRSFPRAPRHCFSPHRDLCFGLLNIRSLQHKVDDILEVQRDCKLDVIMLVETWHDHDSVCLHRLTSVSSVRLSRLFPDLIFSTFEFICVKLLCRSFALVVLLVYRTGPITASFYSDLSQVLDHLATFPIPLLVTGDFNIHVERRDDSHSSMLLDLLASYCLHCQVNSATHDFGGTLDVLFSRDDLPSIPVTVSDPGLSDHRLLTWSLSVAKPPPVYATFTYRPWRRVNVPTLRALLSNSVLCQPESWANLNADQLADLFDSSAVSYTHLTLPTILLV